MWPYPAIYSMIRNLVTQTGVLTLWRGVKEWQTWMKCVPVVQVGVGPLEGAAVLLEAQLLLLPAELIPLPLDPLLLTPALVLHALTLALQELTLHAVKVQPLLLHLQPVSLTQEAFTLLLLPEQADSLALRAAVCTTAALTGPNKG